MYWYRGNKKSAPKSPGKAKSRLQKSEGRIDAAGEEIQLEVRVIILYDRATNLYSISTFSQKFTNLIPGMIITSNTYSYFSIILLSQVLIR